MGFVIRQRSGQDLVYFDPMTHLLFIFLIVDYRNFTAWNLSYKLDHPVLGDSSLWLFPKLAGGWVVGGGRS